MIKGSNVCFECLAHKHGYYSAKDMLNDYYWIKMLTTKQIAELIGVTFSAVTERLHFYNIPLRSVGSAGRIDRYRKEVS
jgi:hypothetical protein